jgi:hypothetical protein
MNQEILSRFCFHKPDEIGISKMKDIRIKIRELAHLIDAHCPFSREKATALTQLSFVMMSANSAIIQEYPIDSNDLTAKELEGAASHNSQYLTKEEELKALGYKPLKLE